MPSNSGPLGPVSKCPRGLTSAGKYAKRENERRDMAPNYFDKIPLLRVGNFWRLHTLTSPSYKEGMRGHHYFHPSFVGETTATSVANLQDILKKDLLDEGDVQHELV